MHAPTLLAILGKITRIKKVLLSKKAHDMLYTLKYLLNFGFYSIIKTQQQ